MNIRELILSDWDKAKEYAVSVCGLRYCNANEEYHLQFSLYNLIKADSTSERERDFILFMECASYVQYKLSKNKSI